MTCQPPQTPQHDTFESARRRGLWLKQMPNGGWLIRVDSAIGPEHAAFTTLADMLRAFRESFGDQAAVDDEAGDRTLDRAQPTSPTTQAPVETAAPAPTQDTPPKAPATEPSADDPPPITGPWTDQEGAAALQMHRNGASNLEIAEKLNRDVRGIGPKLRYLLPEAQKQEAAPPQADPAPAPRQAEAATPPEPNPEPAAPAQDWALPPMPDNLTNAQRVIWRRLDEMGYPAPWTPQKDVQLTEKLVRGDGLSAAADALLIPARDCRMRWNAMLPAKTVEGQADLLKVLKWRCVTVAA